MSWSKRSLGYRALSLAVAVALSMSLTPALSAEDATGSVAGVVRGEDGRQPLAGAVVHLAERGNGTIHSAAATNADGSFEIAGLAPGAYEVGVESAGGIFLVFVPVTVEAGGTQRLDLMVTDSPAARKQVRAGRQVGTAGVWSNPLTAALIVIGGAVAVAVVADAADDDDETSATDF